MLFRVLLSKFFGLMERIEPLLMMPIWTSDIFISLDDIDLQMNQESSDFYKAFIDPYSFTMAISGCFCPKVAALILSLKFSIVIKFFRIWQIEILGFTYRTRAIKVSSFYSKNIF